ncbi:dynein axonemal heavy chain 6 [Haplochromis burtoni]|uniref:dynein axonemal heavy chain 6 n=1 Tax=Haplochromis burtoni TaxID=8153 RepID=UPI0003BC9A0B|nr:dynein axonemal heavy chain 6 [Haplochromis burtoni]
MSTPPLPRLPIKSYRLWKSFYVWHRNVRANKMTLARKSLQKNLFIVIPNLSPALMDIRKMCCQLIETGFCHMKKKYAYTLQEFQDSKIKQLREAYSDLKRFHELVKEKTVYTCGRYLMDAKARVGAYMMWILFKTHTGGHELIATVAI